MNYILGVFANHTTRQATFTARTADHAHLPMMEEDGKERGFQFMVLATGLDKAKAEAFKAIQIAAYENAGYTHVPRWPKV
jgi:hypothetical protein